MTILTGCDSNAESPDSSFQKEILYEKNLKQLMLNGNTYEAEKKAKKMLKKYPENAVAYNVLGLINDGKYNLDVAKYYYKKAIKYSPKSANFHANLSKTYLVEENFKKAIEEMSIALKYKPNSVMYLIDLGYYYSVIGDVNKGIELTKKALKHDSENIRALNQLGIYYMAKKDEEKAYKFFHLALKYAPNNETTFRNLAKGYYVFGRYDKALNYSKQRIDNNAATKDDYRIAAFCYYNKKEFSKAEKYIEIALKDVDLQDESLKRLYKIHVSDLNDYTFLGILYFDQGKIEKAEETFDKMHRAYPGYPRNYYGFGKIYFKRHEYSKAENYLKKYLELKDNNEEYINDAKQILIKIEDIKDGKEGKLSEAA